MVLEEQLAKINDKFKMEISVIKEYLEFMEMSVVLTGLKSKNHSLLDAGMDSSDINNIQNKIESLRLKNKNDISNLENKITESQFYEIPEWFSSIDSRSYEGELINFIYELIENGINDREDIMLELTKQLEFLSTTEGENVGGEFYLELYDNREKAYKYIDYTLKIYHNNLIYYNKEKLQELINFERLLRLIDTKNNINIYRQAFIQLMALFDAFVFDVIRVKFKNNFFEWLELFENDTVKLHDIAKCNDFDKFENTIIDKKLKSVYLKDIIHIMKSHNPELFNIDGEIKYANFIEMINRRNCHIHNNGVIDNSYLGINKINDKPEFNIYNFSIGSYAEINRQYLDESLYYCSVFMNNLTQI